MKRTVVFRSLPFALIAALALLLHGCKKDDEGASISNNTGSSTSTSFYFRATIDGQQISFEDGKDGYGCGAGSSGGSVADGYQEVQTSTLMKPFSPGNSAGIGIMRRFASSSAGPEIENMFTVSSYSYGREHASSTDSNDVDGAKVYYFDANGTYWATDQGAADQTGSSFSITEHITNSDGYSHRISKAVFSCKLYDGNGNIKTLTGGEMRGRTVLY